MPRNPCMLLALLTLAVIAPASSAGDLIFYQDFEEGFDGRWSLGSGRALHSENLTLVGGWNSTGGVWVQPKEFLRYDADGNVNMDECTIILRVRLNWDPPDRRPSYGGIYQQVWGLETRDGNSILLRFRVESPRTYLEFVASSTGTPLRGVNCDVAPRYGRGWRSGEWHEIVCSWRKPGTLKLSIDGEIWGQTHSAPIPNLSANDMLNLYIGTNRESAFGRMDHLDGVIDDIGIFSGFDLERFDVNIEELPLQDELPGLAVPRWFHSDSYGEMSDVRWVSECRYRINLEASPQSGSWATSPVWVDVDFEKVLEGLGALGQLSKDTIRIVEYDPRTGEPVPYDPLASGELRYFIPYVLDATFDWSRAGRIGWAKAGPGPACYSIYFDTSSVYDAPYPLETPLVGNGDRLRLGSKGDPGRLSVGIWGAFDVADLDRDGDPDLVINSGMMTAPNTDLQLGLFYFENLGGQNSSYLFAPGRLIGNAFGNTGYGLLSGNSGIQLVDIDLDGSEDILYVGQYAAEWAEVEWNAPRPVITRWHRLDFAQPFDAATTPGKDVAWNLPRSTYVDWDGDGKRELVTTEYVYLNAGEDTDPRFGWSRRESLGTTLRRDHREVDWDGDGDLDVVCADRYPQIWLYENTGTRREPLLSTQRVLRTAEGDEIWIPGQLNFASPYDWDGDGDLDIIWCGEDGFVGFVENTAGAGAEPRLAQSRLVMQVDAWVDSGSLCIPQVCDWDADGDLDLITGGSDAYILYFENGGTNQLPVFLGPEEMEAGGRTIELVAGMDGSVQGPKEAYWGYNNPEVADWDGDGDLDLIVSGIRGDHTFFENVGTAEEPVLAEGAMITVDWDGEPARPPWLPYRANDEDLITVWRSRPEALDWDGDGLMDYVCLDHLGELALYERFEADGELKMLPGKNIFKWDQGTSRLRIWSRKVDATGGQSGRTVINLVDWDGDGDRDLITDCMNARLYENIADDSAPHFADRGDLVAERLVNHNTGPCAIDWDGDGLLDLFVGAESGQIYYFHRAYIEDDCSTVRLVSIETRSSSIGSGPSIEEARYLPMAILLSVLALFGALVLGWRRSRASRG
jgi:hypothetical protein